MEKSTALLSGYRNYSNICELDNLSNHTVPAITPTTTVTASSPECVAFTIGLTSGGIGISFAAGC